MFDAFAIGHEKRFSVFETCFVRAKVVAKIGGRQLEIGACRSRIGWIFAGEAKDIGE